MLLCETLIGFANLLHLNTVIFKVRGLGSGLRAERCRARDQLELYCNNLRTARDWTQGVLHLTNAVLKVLNRAHRPTQ